MSDNFYEIGFTQRIGEKAHAQHDALWNGEFCIQQNTINTGKRFRNGSETVLLAVADGISSTIMPQSASSFVAECVGALNPSLGVTAATIRDIHGQICDRFGQGTTKGIATTLVAASLRDDACQVVSVGDSRAYLITGSGQWSQLSRDYCYPSEIKESGNGEAAGDESKLHVHHMDCLIADHEKHNFPIHSMQTQFIPGDSLLLCSDGLYDVVPEDELKRLYKPRFPPADQVEVWLRAVLDAGAPDNVSIILARLNRRGRRNGIYLEQVTDN